MKRYILITMLVGCFALASSHAQQKYEHGVIVKKLFTDYHAFNGDEGFDFQDWTGGYELGYTGYFNDKWSIAIPFKVSEVKLPESVYNKRFMGVDLQIQSHFMGRSKKVNPYFSAGFGFVSENGDSSHIAIPLALGAQIAVGPKTDLNGEIAYRLSLDDNRDALHVGLGFVHRFGKVMAQEVIPVEKEPIDSDMDGIADDVDLCPQVPGLEAFFGCPDTDGDGIQDEKDDCPEQPGTKDLNGCPDSDLDGVSDKEDECPKLAGTIANKGCPEIEKDTDRDGILDKDDRCPNEGGTIANGGCPEVVKIVDRDGDGVNDDVDRCPDGAGPRYLNGCPDTDGDGVPDIDDSCITVPGPATNRGCPAMEKADRETLAFAVQAVEFDFGKATLRSNSFSVLNKVADVMKRYPGYKLRITGHTDSVGDTQRNLTLSERRARSCYEYLSTRGIPIARMSYSGMGKAQPIDSNNTEEGRSRNRRVEFDVYVD